MKAGVYKTVTTRYVRAWKFDPDARRPPTWLPKIAHNGGDNWIVQTPDTVLHIRSGEWLVCERGTLKPKEFIVVTEDQFKLDYRRSTSGRPPNELKSVRRIRKIMEHAG